MSKADVIRRVGNVLYYIDDWSDVLVGTGLALIFLGAGWDILKWGFRGFFEYAVYWKGIATIIVGALCVSVAWFTGRYLG